MVNACLNKLLSAGTIIRSYGFEDSLATRVPI